MESERQRFWTDNVALGLATIVAGFFNTAYSVVLAHSLGPFDYGRVGALNSLVSLFLLPLPIVSLIAIRTGRQSGRSWLPKATIGAGLAVFGVAAWLSPGLSHVLGLSPLLIMVYGSSVILNFAYALYVGYLERARRYAIVGLLLVTASGLSVLSVVGAVTVGHRHPVLWLGIVQTVVVVGMFGIARRLQRDVPPLAPRRLKSTVVATTLGVGTLQALWGLSDSLFAKAHLPGPQAGLYIGINTIGQALPFVVSSFATVMLTAVLDDPLRAHYYLRRTMMATALLAVLFLAVVGFVPKTLIRLALGGSFLPIAPLLFRYALAMAFLTVTLVLTTYGVALGLYRTMVAASLGTLAWIVLLAGGFSLESLVNRTLVAMLATLLVVGLVFWQGPRPSDL